MSLAGTRKEVNIAGEAILLFWYRNEIYAIESRCVVPPSMTNCRSRSKHQAAVLTLSLHRSPAEGNYSEGFIQSKFTQVSCGHCARTWAHCLWPHAPHMQLASGLWHRVPHHKHRLFIEDRRDHGLVRALAQASPALVSLLPMLLARLRTCPLQQAVRVWQVPQKSCAAPHHPQGHLPQALGVPGAPHAGGDRGGHLQPGVALSRAPPPLRLLWCCALWMASITALVMPATAIEQDLCISACAALSNATPQVWPAFIQAIHAPPGLRLLPQSSMQPAIRRPLSKSGSRAQVASGRSAKNLQQSQNNDVMVVETREYLGDSEGPGTACYCPPT